MRFWYLNLVILLLGLLWNGTIQVVVEKQCILCILCLYVCALLLLILWPLTKTCDVHLGFKCLCSSLTQSLSMIWYNSTMDFRGIITLFKMGLVIWMQIFSHG
jgi:hypothetical protein